MIVVVQLLDYIPISRSRLCGGLSKIHGGLPIVEILPVYSSTSASSAGVTALIPGGGAQTALAIEPLPRTARLHQPEINSFLTR